MFKRSVIVLGITAQALLLVFVLISILAGAEILTEQVAFASATGGLPGSVVTTSYTVCPTGPPQCDYSIVQEAIDGAEAGDLIKVGRGIYTNVNTHGGLAQIAYITKSISLRGGYDPDNFNLPPDPEANPTILDAQSGGRVIYMGDATNILIEGFTITGGDATDLGPIGDDYGGGIYITGVSSTTIRGNKVISNHLPPSSSWGGGIAVTYSQVRIIGNLVSSNDAAFGGGMIVMGSSASVIQDNFIANNNASAWGGGLWFGGSTLISNTISGNQASWGGGIYGGGNIWGNIISDNSANSGGGVYVWGSSSLINNRIFSNTATNDGGGVNFFLGPQGVGLIQGNTIANNSAGHEGGGVYVWYASLLYENTILGNSATNGAGVAIYPGARGIVQQNLIANNMATGDGGGIYARLALVRNNVISENEAFRGGGLFFYNDYTDIADSEIINNVVNDNGASVGSGLYVEAVNLAATNNTIARNLNGDGVGIYVDDNGLFNTEAALENTILVSQTTGIYVATGNTASLEATLWGANEWANVSDWAGDGTILTGAINLWETPGFVAPFAGDYHLRADSPAVDSGVQVLLDEDVDGDFRPMNWGYDIGADEFLGPGLGITSWPSSLVLKLGGLVTYTVIVTGDGQGVNADVTLVYNLDQWQRPVSVQVAGGACFLTDPDWGGTVNCDLGQLTFGDGSTITVTAQVSPSANVGWPMTNMAQVASSGTVNYIETTTFAEDCHVRLNDVPVDYDSIQDAVDAAVTGDLVKVAGVCLGAEPRDGLIQQVYLTKTVTLQGGYSSNNWLNPDSEANPTTLNALGQGRVIYITGNINPTLSGLNITGGSASGIVVDSSGALIIGNKLFDNTASQSGGAISVSGYSPSYTVSIISNQIYSNSATINGGGLSLGGSDIEVIGNVIFDNQALRGGAAYLNGSADFENNIIYGNAAILEGGGFAIYGIGYFRHNTLARNTAREGAGLFMDAFCFLDCYPSAAYLTNTIIVGHSEAINAGWYDDNLVQIEATLWGSGTWANGVDLTGTGTIVSGSINLWEEPNFVNSDQGNYHVTATSPAVDAGIETGVAFDIDGQLRPFGPAPDIGADEFVGENSLFLPVVISPAIPKVGTALKGLNLASLLLLPIGLWIRPKGRGVLRLMSRLGNQPRFKCQSLGEFKKSERVFGNLIVSVPHCDRFFCHCHSRELVRAGACIKRGEGHEKTIESTGSCSLPVDNDGVQLVFCSGSGAVALFPFSLGGGAHGCGHGCTIAWYPSGSADVDSYCLQTGATLV